MLGAGVCSMVSPASLTAGTSARPRRAPRPLRMARFTAMRVSHVENLAAPRN